MTELTPVATRQGGTTLGLAAVAAATLTWSFGAVLGKAVDAPGVVTTVWRLWLGAALWWLIAAVAGQRPDRRALRVAAPAGALFGFNLALFFTAVQHTTVANASIIGALTPVAMLPLAVRLLGERLDAIKVGCALLAVAGVVGAVLSVPSGGSGSGRSNLGDGLAVASLVLWVFYLLSTKQARKEIGTVPLLTAATTVAAVVVTPLAIFGDYDLGAISGRGWLWLILLTVVPGALGHGLVAWAQHHVDASVSSVLMQGEPVGATVAAALFLSEPLGGWQMVWLAVVVVALALLALHTSRPRPAAAAVEA